MTSGMLMVSDDPEVIKAFNLLSAGLRSGRRRDELRPYLEILEAAQNRAFESPAGIDYLAVRPILKQQREDRLRKLGQK